MRIRLRIKALGKLFDNIPGDLPQEVFETLCSSEAVKIQRIVSRGHTSPQSGWYDQPDNEWVLVVKGKAIIDFVDKPSVTLQEGDYLDIAAHEQHRVAWTDPQRETVWLAVHYRDSGGQVYEDIEDSAIEE